MAYCLFGVKGYDRADHASSGTLCQRPAADVEQLVIGTPEKSRRTKWRAVEPVTEAPQDSAISQNATSCASTSAIRSACESGAASVAREAT